MQQSSSIWTGELRFRKAISTSRFFRAILSAGVFAPPDSFHLVRVSHHRGRPAPDVPARTLFLRNRTTLSPYESPVVLITTGPFSISRNPVYLAMAAMLFGSAVVMGTILPFVFVVLFIAIIEVLFIPDEERMLEEIFGEEYREYKRDVRRGV